ncbi:hypothetical protein, partial [Sulfurimonas sp.]|uniref:hypothetical protein n=1 Tax=Sulfurimonas sp. TaxID=2022749 RepID=UPI0035642F11
MKKIQVIIKLNEETQRFEALTIENKALYTAAKKADLKTTIKRSKKYDLEIVEKFAKPEVKKVQPKKSTKPEVKKGPESKDQKDIYGEYQQYIIDNAKGDIKCTGDLVASFCNKFDLKLSKKKRSLTFERV